VTNPKTGFITREWEVEAIVSNIHAAGGVALFSSARHPVVSEAYPLQVAAGGTIAGQTTGTVVAHDNSFPSQGTVGATQAATIGPQSFLMWGAPGTVTTGLFLIRGR
jgi:hypothetical protein